MKSPAFSLVLILCGTITGCGIVQPITKSEAKLARLSLSEDRQLVLAKIGEPDSVRGAKKMANGSTLQVDEYRMYKKGTALFDAVLCPFTVLISCLMPSPRREVEYWVQYVDGKLDRWGKAGDWQADITADVNIHQK